MNVADSVVPYDQRQFDALIKECLSKYGHMLKDMESATEVLKDDYGNIIQTMPYLKVTMKDGVDIVQDLMNHKAIRVHH